MNPGAWLTLAAGVAIAGDSRGAREVAELAGAGELVGLAGLELFGYLPRGSSSALSPVVELEQRAGAELLEAAEHLGKALFPP